MVDTEESPESTDDSDDDVNFDFPKVNSFDDVNQNFKQMSDALHVLVREIRNNADTTNKNVTRLFTDVDKSVRSFDARLNSMMSSQTMVIVVVILCLFIAVVILKSVFNTASLLFS